MFFVYILLCNGTYYYVGMTNDLVRRLQEHQSGKSPYTRRYKDIELKYFESITNKSAALSREKQVKGWTRVKKEALIVGDITKLKSIKKTA